MGILLHLDELLELLEVTKSSKTPEALLSKLQSKKISEDGNSETTAAKKAESDNKNANNGEIGQLPPPGYTSVLKSS